MITEAEQTVIKTIIPIPPSQWVKERQNKMDLGKTSMSVKIEEPVVVNPEQLSKNASINESIAPDAAKGIAPKKATVSQLNDTIRNPSRFFSGCRERLTSERDRRPITMHKEIVNRKASNASLSLLKYAMVKGISMETAIIINRLPSTLKIVPTL